MTPHLAHEEDGMTPKDWQDIETAPKDGTTVLLWWQSNIGRDLVSWWACGQWQEFGDGSRGWTGDSFHCSEPGSWTRLLGERPTHWMPLTSPLKKPLHEFGCNFEQPCSCGLTPPVAVPPDPHLTPAHQAMVERETRALETLAPPDPHPETKAAKPFADLRAQMSPASQARAAARTAELSAELDRWCRCLRWQTVDGHRCTACGKPIASATASTSVVPPDPAAPLAPGALHDAIQRLPVHRMEGAVNGEAFSYVLVRRSEVHHAIAAIAGTSLDAMSAGATEPERATGGTIRDPVSSSDSTTSTSPVAAAAAPPETDQ